MTTEERILAVAREQADYLGEWLRQLDAEERVITEAAAELKAVEPRYRVAVLRRDILIEYLDKWVPDWRQEDCRG